MIPGLSSSASRRDYQIRLPRHVYCEFIRGCLTFVAPESQSRAYLLIPSTGGNSQSEQTKNSLMTAHGERKKNDEERENVMLN